MACTPFKDGDTVDKSTADATSGQVLKTTDKTVASNGSGKRVATIASIFDLYKISTDGTDVTHADTSIFSDTVTMAALLSAAGNLNLGGELNHDGSKIGFFSVAPVVQQTVADLTDSSGGSSGGNTIAAIATAVADPADSPADADALRDDLVTNTIPSIESNLSDCRDGVATLAAKMQQIIDLLEAYGLEG